MVDDPTSLSAHLEVIARLAPRLRAAGVQHLTIDGVSMALAPPDPPEPVDVADDAPKTLLEDPESYGLPDGAEVPGFRRPDDLPRG